MRKIFSLFTAIILAVMTANPCSAKSITVSIFPVYDWVREISKGVSNDITLLLDSGVDLHSYQPSAEDIVRISDCDLFVYVGGESDEWADGVLKVSAENQRRVINLLDVLGDSVKPEEIVDGMQHEHHHEHSEPDEHVWLSLRNAEIICRKLADTLSETVIFLAQKADELNLPCVIKIDGTNHKIAETVVKSSKNHDRRILVLDSMQSATMNDIKAGKTYLNTMRSNLEILKEALN